MICLLITLSLQTISVNIKNKTVKQYTVKVLFFYYWNFHSFWFTDVFVGFVFCGFFLLFCNKIVLVLFFLKSNDKDKEKIERYNYQTDNIIRPCSNLFERPVWYLLTIYDQSDIYRTHYLNIQWYISMYISRHVNLSASI